MQPNEIDYVQPGTPINPPKSTLISIVPFPISEFKPGLIPGQFDIPASVNGHPQCLIVGECLHYVYIDKDRGSLRVNNPSYVIARSIVNDYNSAQLAVSIDKHPGLFWALGEYTPEQVEVKFKDQLIDIGRIQHDWFVELVKLADDDWEKTRQHYSISDIQRYAVKSIDPGNTRMRPWVMDVAPASTAGAQETTLCPACGSDIPTSVVICRYCRYVIDSKRYNAMSFAADAAKIDVGKILKQ